MPLSRLERAGSGGRGARLLRSELADIARTGIGYDRQEHTVGICAVGAAVVGPSGPVLTLSLPVPTERFIASQDDLVATLRTAVAEATDLLGLPSLSR